MSEFMKVDDKTLRININLFMLHKLILKKGQKVFETKKLREHVFFFFSFNNDKNDK